MYKGKPRNEGRESWARVTYRMKLLECLSKVDAQPILAAFVGWGEHADEVEVESVPFQTL